MKYLKGFIHCFAISCYILIGIYACICIPSLFGYKPLIVLTGSMEPTYKVGSIIYYKKVSQNELKVGDAITFKLSDGSFVSHRIVDFIGDNYITKGDANNAHDANPVNYKNVVGKDAKISIPYLGYFIKIVNSNMWFVAVVIAVLILEFFLADKKEGDINAGREQATKE